MREFFISGVELLLKMQLCEMPLRYPREKGHMAQDTVQTEL